MQGRAGTTEGTAFVHESMAQARNVTIRLSDLADSPCKVGSAWMRGLTLCVCFDFDVSMFAGFTFIVLDAGNVSLNSMSSVHSCNIEYDLAPDSSFHHVAFDFLPC